MIASRPRGSQRRSSSRQYGLKYGNGDDDTPVSTDKNISWIVPSGWTEQPAISMHVGSFLATGSNGQKVDISVVPLSGPAGGTLANINRWRGQINLPPIEDQDLSRLTETIKSGTKDMLLVDFVSEQNMIDNKFMKRLVAATYTNGEQTWFFKMTGEDQAVKDNKSSFIKFLRSLKFPSHGQTRPRHRPDFVGPRRSVLFGPHDALGFCLRLCQMQRLRTRISPGLFL